MLAGDETTGWTDAGPCPACGDTDCWLGCPEADIDDTTDACPTCGAPDYQLICPDTDEVLCGCDYCNMVGEPCWKARAAQSGSGQ